MKYYLFFDDNLLDENFPFAVAPRVGDKIHIFPDME